MAANKPMTGNWADEQALAGAYWDHVEALIARHDHALERAGAAHAVIFSGAPRLRFLDDNHYPFQPNPHFVSWLPLTAHPYCYLVHTPGETPVLIYYQEKDYWHLPPAAPEGYWTAYFDVRVVHELDDVARHLPEARDKCILIGEIDDEQHAFGIERINPTSAMNILHYARSSKTPWELECMRAASRRAVAGHRAAEAIFRDGGSEFDIHLAYCAAVGQTEHALPYGNIIALNEHAAVLHYQHQSRHSPPVRRSFLIDAGASVNGYAADITRTYSCKDDAFADLVDRMHELQLAITAEVRVGVNYADLHIRTHERIAELLVDLNLASGSSDALYSNGVTSAFYPHGLGHLLGLQVHDVGGFMADENGSVIDRPPGHPFLRLTRTLEADQVLTIEPGLYFIDLLLENLEGTPGSSMLNHAEIDKLKPYGGVRIEDNVRVLDGGCENLTRDAFSA
jgi:Xaa-Pro dipeptidase